ncbi:basic proline-rich protein-like [Formica exsecta]|uniref:basic proline-rich protein-like n=1 Tax=Formica exsecta TaxID=72781 RepID=UPI001143BDE3|nr:basic proline-rich protein-like [Formica exsecta]
MSTCRTSRHTRTNLRPKTNAWQPESAVHSPPAGKPPSPGEFSDGPGPTPVTPPRSPDPPDHRRRPAPRVATAIQRGVANNRTGGSTGPTSGARPATRTWVAPASAPRPTPPPPPPDQRGRARARQQAPRANWPVPTTCPAAADTAAPQPPPAQPRCAATARDQPAPPPLRAVGAHPAAPITVQVAPGTTIRVPCGAPCTPPPRLDPGGPLGPPVQQGWHPAQQPPMTPCRHHLKGGGVM